MLNVKVELYENQEAGVELTWDPDSVLNETESKLLEPVLLACYVLRVFSNLGSNRVGAILAQRLFEWSPQFDPVSGLPDDSDRLRILDHSILFYDALEQGRSEEEALRQHGDPVWLVKYQGEGKKQRQFLGQLVSKDYGFRYKFDVKGFSFLKQVVSLETSKWAIDSVFVFLSYLMLRNEQDEATQQNLKLVARACARAWMDERVTMLNQEQLAEEIVTSVFLPDGE